MAEKELKARIVHKHDTEANWSKAENFIPKKGEIIIYDAEGINGVPRFKIGNGEDNVNQLSFAGDSVVSVKVTGTQGNYTSSITFNDLAKSYQQGKVLLCNLHTTDENFIDNIPLAQASEGFIFSTIHSTNQGLKEIVVGIGENSTIVSERLPEYDTTVKSNSYNAVSGKAVSDALATKMGIYGNTAAIDQSVSFYSRGGVTTKNDMYMIKMGEQDAFEIGYIGPNGEKMIRISNDGVTCNVTPTINTSVANKKYVDDTIDQKLGVIENGSY